MSPRTKLVLLFILFSSPIAASYVMYYFYKPDKSINYGELMTVAPLPDPALQTDDNKPTKLSDLRGKWLMLTVDSGQCAAACANKLYVMRQVRLAQGKYMDRIERVMLIDDAAALNGQSKTDYADTHFLRAQNSELLRNLPAQAIQRDHIYLIDPLGNLVLRYPRDPDPRKMIKDFSRLLTVSKIG
ncbi:MAG: cytochrome C oxidase subunit I [Burkholderiales bacterium]